MTCDLCTQLPYSLQLMPSYVSVHSPADTTGASAATPLTISLQSKGGGGGAPSVEPEISMPLSVAPGDATIGCEDAGDAGGGASAQPGAIGDVLILDPSTMTLHPAPPTLSYVIGGKKVRAWIVKRTAVIYFLSCYLLSRKSEWVAPIDYRCDNRRFWLSAHNCQVPTPTSQNPELEEQIRIFGAD
jgi:hypothetical protein